MSDEPGAPYAGLLPDGFHRSARPGTVLLRLETTRSREGALDGAWWPRSRDIGAELPGLVAALTEHLGPVASVGLDTDAWDDVPARLVVDGRSVHIDRHPVGDDTVIITRGDRDHFSLLVVPPQASLEAAHAAMAQAVLAGGTDSAQQILIAAGIGSVPPGEVL
ncbi:DUF5994 family protein [Streptomyces sp. BE20]|uniref:DUF5994 family protein n=1 Tax=Streptomycetaceae TaxID=2062 RepID=UPI002E7725B9|nr:MULTISPECIES: DUF5994 family protein [unclassified Streptomyces]MED7948266.1 DUF5994 family protein [Streptomyces sp. BE303]MEE1827675.1 DUF5994 family protein [Streptomyces sp. BE20]